MTMKNELDEESLLLEQLQGARHAVEVAKKAVAAARIKQNEAEAALEVMNQAVLDFCNAHGLIKFESGKKIISIGISESVDIENPSSVPDEYMREKICREPDKIKIRAERPKANWYSIKERQKITITDK